MKYFLAAALVCLNAAAQSVPTIGIIDTYGNKSLSPEKLRKELKVVEGDPLPPSKGDLEEMLVAMKGVARANIEAICCEQGKAIFYVGVEERGRPHLDIREEPKNESLKLPEDVSAIYEKWIAATAEATRLGETREDWSQGFSLLDEPNARGVQLQLPAIAEDHQAILRQIIRESADPDDRRVAAAILGYGPKAQSIIEDLQLALRDPDQEVRAAALRSLGPIAFYANAHPEDVSAIYEKWIAATAEATRLGETREDWSQGFSLLDEPNARGVQLQLPAIAEDHQAILRQIIRESADPDDRRVAAAILGYGPKAQSIIEDLQLALRDPDQEVRAAALRSLGPIAFYATAHPEAEIRVLTTWFVEMLNSVAWKDRMNAMNLLIALTTTREEKLIRHMRERGIPALAEMAMWKHLPHALPAYILLGRVAGLTDKEIEDTWSANQREVTIQKMRKKLKA